MSDKNNDYLNRMSLADLHQHLVWVQDALMYDRQGLVEVMLNTRRITLNIADKEARIAAIEKRILQLTQEG